MRPPCEIVVKRLLPLLRALVARELMTVYGWTQSRAARRLGVTQPAVSSYLSLLEGEERRGFDLEDLEGLAKRIAEGLARGEMSLSETVMEVCSLCIKLKSGGFICALHKQRVPDLRRESCDVCLRLFGTGAEEIEERYKVLNDLRKAVEMIEGSKDFPSVMPEVRVNMVVATSDARSISDVAGIPGRIVEVRGRARAFMEPEFGSSRHLAEVLLTAREIDPSVRAAANIKYDEAVREAMERLKLRMGLFDREALPPEERGEEGAVSLGIKLVAEEFGYLPDVVVDKGGYGIEPVSYLFGGSAVEVAERAIQIAEALNK
ncbi:transcriptional regulator [Candidatus Bathyarchaeota archaeon]|nr:MAG: transcriptional regulator [Candidatus Bathyarchaeota archaeon]